MVFPGVRKHLGAVAVVVGIVVGQFVLYGPSLVGRTILLPLDILAEPQFYLPQTPEIARIVPHDPIMSDLVLDTEPLRRFAVSEIWSGRLPFWLPGIFGGAPYYRWPLSPAVLLRYVFASPVVLAWNQMLVAVVAGLGAYVFCRRTLGVGFWPAVLVGWSYPLTGTYVIWQTFVSPPVICWLPWSLAAVDSTVRRPFGWGGPALAGLTTIVLLNGHIDIGGQLLLTCGLFALWRYGQLHGGEWLSRRALPSLAVPAAAWTLGILASMWLVLPLVESTQAGARMARRIQGVEERPPTGLSALPQVVVPEFWGLTIDGSLYVAAGNVPESAVGAFAGLVAALVVAPLAWCSRRHRGLNSILLLLIILSLSWVLNLPGIVSLLRLPGMNMMSHNRFVFVASLMLLALAAVGLDALLEGLAAPRWWFALPAAALVLVAGACIYQLTHLPEPVATQLGVAVQQGRSVRGIHDAAGVASVQARFVRTYAAGAALAVLGLTAWGVLAWRPAFGRRLVPVLGTVMIGELLAFAFGYNAQCEPELYYPPLPVLEQIAHSEPGRVIGFGCLPPDLAVMHGLRDIRGYDGVDPLRMVELLGLVDEQRTRPKPHALTQWIIPKIGMSPAGELRFPPILDMLNVRYMIFRGTPPADITPHFQSDDYWAVTNSRALPRAYVPAGVEVVDDGVLRKQRLADPDFDPRTVAIVERELAMDVREECRGTVRVTDEVPMRVTLAVEMQTPGLVVLADAWDSGWRAYLNGRQVEVLRANHALRGVLVPAGRATLEFRYEPASLRRGALLSGLAIVIWIGWVGSLLVNSRRSHEPAENPLKS